VLHSDQLTISAEAVRGLVAGQFPAWAGLPVRLLETEGTVHAIARLGERLAVRLPLRAGDPAEVGRRLAAEAAAGRELAAATAVPAPAPVALGAPGPGYPLPWSVWTWLPGRTAGGAESAAFARDLAALVRDLRAVDPAGRTFAGPGRGGDLRTHEDWVATCLRESVGLLDVPRLRGLWVDLRDLPRTDPDRMTHGDLMPGNVLVAGGRLAGVLDTGGFGPADPALELVAGWHLLDAGPRAVFRAELGGDDLQWARGAAWALEQSLGLVWYYRDSAPGLSRTGRRTLDRVVAELAPASRTG
jgi:aminoglycoside phosphotransferase (APT) family kinase protein